MEKLVNNAELKAEKAECLRIFSGVKLLHIRNQIELILGKIGENGIFYQYTKHDISHVDEMLRMLDWIIPQKTQEIMTSAEWMMIVLSIYFHDMGMLVTNKEFENRDSSNYKDYKNKEYIANGSTEFINKIDSLDDDEKEKFLYQEYVRKNHASRIRKWIQGEVDIEDGACCEIIEVINDLLNHIDKLFKYDLGIICESHHLNNLDDISIYNVRKRYGSSDSEIVNLQYIAVLLRTVDLLHITMDRTPTIEYRLICPTDPISVIEWQKQMAVRAVTPKEKRDEEGNITDKLEKDTIEISAYFEKANQAEAFFALMDYLRYAKEELKLSHELIQNSIKKQGTKNYLFPWINIDDDSIKTKDFERKLLKFELNQANILQMLVGHTLYNDSSVVLRELIQNGLDAVKLQNEIEKKNNISTTSGKIVINWNKQEKILEFLDNGTGMSIYEIENYLLKIGSSRYSSKEFVNKFPEFVSISRFGIGILTCFLVANDVEILTNSDKCEKANFITLRNVDGRYLLKKVDKKELPENIRSHGTSIKLHIRDEINMNDIKNDIKKWIIFPQCSVFYSESDDTEERIGYDTPKDAIEEYVSKSSLKENIVVKEETIEGITIAYALQYREFFQEYGLIDIADLGYLFQDIDMPIPVGVCFEGIRVSDDTPGYKAKNFLAIMNSKNCKIAQTNVARSSIEDNSSKEKLLRVIYTIYRNYVGNQINFLKENKYSFSWISHEVEFLIFPLFRSVRDRKLHENDLIENSELLKEVFSELEGILFEENQERKLVSAKYLQSKPTINFAESNLILAAESLLRETKTNIALNSLANILLGDDEFDGNELLCNYESSNILHREALRDRYAASICVKKEERRIDICYKKIDNPWIDVTIYGNPSFFHREYKNVHVPRKLDEDLINGLNDEFGVVTKAGLFLSSKHRLTKYLVEKINIFQYYKSEKEFEMLRIMLSYMLNNGVLMASKRDNNLKDIEQYFYNLVERDNVGKFSAEIFDELWGKIDRNEFLSIIFEQKDVIYDITDWSRYDKSISRIIG